MNLQQEKFQSVQDFRDQYLAMKKVCDMLDLHIGRCESDARELLKKKNMTNPTDAQLSKAMDQVEEELHAIIFMYKMDRHKYSNILDQMENDVLQKKDPFPKTISEASTLIEGWKGKSNHYTKYNEANDGIAFATDGKEEKTGNKNKKKEITCFKRGEKGHYSNECNKEQSDDSKTVKTSNKMASNFLVTNDNQHGYSLDEDVSEGPYADCDFTAIEENEESEGNDTKSEDSDGQEKSSDESFAEEDDIDGYEGFDFLHNDVICSTQDKADIPKMWILLDSQSTVDVFSNPCLLTNIRDSKTTLTLHFNAGKAVVAKKGDLKGFGTIWYYPEGIATFCLCTRYKKNTRSHMTVLLWQGL